MRNKSTKEKYALEQLKAAIKCKEELYRILQGLADPGVSLDDKLELHNRYITLVGTLDLKTILEVLEDEAA